MSSRGRDPWSSESAARAIASTQHHLITLAQAVEAGLSKAAVSRRAQSGIWRRVLPAVYSTMPDVAGEHQAAMAATLWAGNGSLVSHSAAAALWRFEGVRSRKVELWIASQRRLRSQLVVVHQGNRLDRADRTALEGIPITTPVRTLIDMSSRLENLTLSAVMEDLIKRDVVDPDRLRARLAALRTSGRPGGGRLEALLDARGAGPAMESTLEALVWSLILKSGVRLPERQYEVKVPGGRYRLDYAWPDLKLGMECDSWHYHGERKEQWGKDRARYAELAVIGYRVVPVTWAVARHDSKRLLRWLRSSLPNAA